MIFILFPHQLFRNVKPLLGKRVLLVEESLFFSQYAFHVQKIILHRASMKAYEAYLIEKGIDVVYIEDEKYLDVFASEDIAIYDVVDFNLQKKLKRQFQNLTIYPNPNFLNSKKSEKLLHSFYIKRRKELGLFVDASGKPQGGKWSFDAQNRKKIPKNTKLPTTLCFDNPFIQEAKLYAKKFETVGSCKDFYYPTTFREATIVLRDFLQNRFALFGDYQDAIVEGEHFLFHSNISSALNIGLLDLYEVIEEVVAFEGIPFNAKEGFIRQIIGWREFMLCIYKERGVSLRNSNFFGFKNKMPKRIREDKSRFIEMAWQDRTPFEAIEKLYGLKENQVIKMMRSLMSKSSFVMWRKRMHGRKTKHVKKLAHKPTRFQGPW